jgi:hypothetical protein
MNLLKAVKNTIFLHPTRCGRTYFSCDILETNESISITLTPTDEFLNIDPRRENEALMPDHVHLFEKWEHMGLCVGDLEHFLTENNIEYQTVVNKETVQMNIVNDTIDREYNLKKQQQLKHAQRSFNLEQAVDEETYNVLAGMIDAFQAEHADSFKVMVTDWETRKKLYALSVYWHTKGEKNGDIRAPQMNAPLIITVPPKEFDTNYYFHMGVLYSKIGLTAIERGYKVAFCNAFNYFDPRIERVQDVLHLEFGTYTEDNFVPRSFICIGNALDESKPYNWVAEWNDNLTSCILVTKSFMSVNQQAELDLEEHV